MRLTIAWLLRLSTLVSFISETILLGFKAGAALTIAMTQLPKLFGVPGGGEQFFDRALTLAGQLGDTNLAVLGLVAINGFFVAAEFSFVAARRSKLDDMIAKGDRGAKTVQAALQHLDRYIAGTQLGITIASLALGWIGEPALVVGPAERLQQLRCAAGSREAAA